jgi:NADH-quinone oxidoreductase subunit K
MLNKLILNNDFLILLDEFEIYSGSLKLGVVFILSFFLFIMGLVGISSNKRNILILMLSIEIILLASVLNFISFSVLFQDPNGQIYALLVITLAACESAIGLGLLVSAYRVKKTVGFPFFNNLRG